MGGDFVLLAGRVGELEQDGGIGADLQRRLEHQADPGGACVDQTARDVAVAGEALSLRTALEAVDDPALLAPADREQSAPYPAQLDQAEQRNDDRRYSGQVR